MCCPYFFPEEPAALADNPRYAMLPLGGFWAGACRAQPADTPRPGHDTLHQFCALGYARGTCSHFPTLEGPDAVRFSVTSDDGASLSLYFVQERDHHPYRHGPLEYSRASRAFVTPPPDAVFARQALAYIESYLRRKDESPQPSSAS